MRNSLDHLVGEREQCSGNAERNVMEYRCDIARWFSPLVLGEELDHLSPFPAGKASTTLTAD